jgi:tetratricopeptide (TPR) repeat protein
MYRSSLFLAAALVGTSIAFVQPAAAAKSAAEVEAIARSVTVEIRLKNSVGSGVIIDRKGDIYTLVTNRHVVCGSGRCSKLSGGASYSLGLPDGQQYKVKTASIKLLGNDLDLAIVQFRSNRNYAVAKVEALGSLKIEDDVYTSGFPLERSGFTFGAGKAIAVVNKRLSNDSGGYTIVYNAFTLPGMSGGGVFDKNGQLVAIHGQGDRFRENTDIDNRSRIDNKTGYNRGIPIRWLVEHSVALGINLGGNRSISDIRVGRVQVPASADEHFVAGFNKLIEPGNDVVTGKQQAIQELSIAIRLNPGYQYAYFVRAIVYEQVGEFQRSLSDYNQAILLNPGNSAVYNNRAVLKAGKMNDIPGALADYNQAILIDPKYSKAYNNRAVLKAGKMNDIPGALADYNQAILLDPSFFEAYYNRGALKADKMNDMPGALADYNQAILINPRFSGTYNNRAALKADKMNDIPGALADYNQAILLDPKFSDAYYSRANLKLNRLNDVPGALADYNQAILLNPKDFEAYHNRANLKVDRLNDVPGALADYNQAILLNPKYPEAYYNRAALNAGKLNDISGAIQDFRQAAQLFREQGNTSKLQIVIEALQGLGASE